MPLGEITDDLVADLDDLTFGSPVAHVYNPLVCAREAWDLYCEKYGQGPREVLLLGMNPGPPGSSNPYEAQQSAVGRSRGTLPQRRGECLPHPS